MKKEKKFHQPQENIQNQSQSPGSYSYLTASGQVPFKMTNDYLFRAVFQSNAKALKGLLCSLLHRKPEEVQTIEITNPIELGKSLDDKTFVLDITLKMNNDSIINIEMQVVNWLNWPERSLSYLCRTFDHLMRGENYLSAKPVTQICFLDFTLFQKFPEFYATYQMLNIKNHNLYSDKFTLSVVDLTQIGAATKEDKANGIDQWAALFKATEWEEIKMLSQENEYLEAASQSMYQLSADERIRQQCAAREENERLERAMQKTKEELETTREELETKREELETKKEELETKKEELETKKEELETKATEIKIWEAQVQALAAKNAEQETKNAEREAKIEKQAAKIEEQKAIVEEQATKVDAMMNKAEEMMNKAKEMIAKAESMIAKAEQSSGK